MFGFLYQLMAGQHAELPRRRGPALTYDVKLQAFVEEERVEHGAWPGRGQVPGQRAADTTSGQTVAEEIRELTAQRRAPR